MKYIFLLLAKISLVLSSKVFNQENHMYWDSKFYYWTWKVMEANYDYRIAKETQVERLV